MIRFCLFLMWFILPSLLLAQVVAPMYRAGQVEITAGDVEDPGEFVVPRLQENAGMIHLIVDPSYPAFLSAEIVLEWIRTNRLVFEGLSYNPGLVTIQQNVVRIRFTYDFIFGQDFVTRSMDFRGTDQFIPTLGRFNFYKQKLNTYRIRIPDGGLPVSLAEPVITEATLIVQSNMPEFEVALTDSLDMETAYRPRTSNLEVKVPPGRYALSALKQGYVPISRNVNMIAGSTRIEEIVFVALPPQVASLPEEIVPVQKNRTFLRFVVFSTLTAASVYGGSYYLNTLSSGSSGIPSAPGRP